MNKRFLQQKKFFQHKLNISTSNKLSCLSYTLAVNMMSKYYLKYTLVLILIKIL